MIRSTLDISLSNSTICKVGDWRRLKRMDPEFHNDSRWQLIERIVASNSFQKSTRLKDLLCYLAEKTLQGTAQELSEHQIGTAALGKPEDYSVVEDSAVRVHMRQLRLRLHEYFNGEGRGETCIVDFPKGSYTAVFRMAEPDARATLALPTREQLPKVWLQLLPWTLAAIFLITTFAAWFHHPSATTSENPPWPLSELFDQANSPLQIVVADANYGLMLLFTEQPVTLSQYLSPSFWNSEVHSRAPLGSRETRIEGYLSASTLTSFADAVVSTSLVRLSGAFSNRLTINSARNLRPRDLESGNFIFIGGPRSNPWVSTFQDKLNFREGMSSTETHADCFNNLHPKQGEQATYCPTSSAEDTHAYYSTVSLLPLPDGHGNVMILQGLQEQGTEATALFLADAGKRRELMQALGIDGTPKQPVYFEALLLTQSIANAPAATTSIVTTRLIRP